MTDGRLEWIFQEIPIDFDVYKALTTKLESPTDSYNAVIRRLLNLPSTLKDSSTHSGRAWVVNGVTFPNNTEFRSRHRGKTILGKVDDGALVVNGLRYESPSPAAMAITGTSVNGWRFWECRRPGQNNWIIIDGLRTK